jgi:hypothetical protein
LRDAGLPTERVTAAVPKSKNPASNAKKRPLNFINATFSVQKVYDLHPGWNKEGEIDLRCTIADPDFAQLHSRYFLFLVQLVERCTILTQA